VRPYGYKLAANNQSVLEQKQGCLKSIFLRQPPSPNYKPMKNLFGIMTRIPEKGLTAGETFYSALATASR
jgi:hypothetical protein